MWRTLILITVCWGLSGCATFRSGDARLPNVEMPLNNIQQAVESSLPLGKRNTSSNGREYFSNYFLVSGKKFKPGDQGPIRYYAHIFILGDRRPYNIDVLVVQERQIDGTAQYEEVGSEPRLAKVILRRLRQQLSKRREDRYFIDDFRVF